MHFSIPDTTEVKDGKNTYTNFNLHVNGVFFCGLRYSQLHDFHEQLRKEEFDLSGLTAFPSKKQTILSLTAYEVDERREELEGYMQSLSQHPHVSKSDLLNNFLLCSQQDAYRVENTAVELDIYLSNGRKVTVDVMQLERADAVLEAVARKIELPEKLTYYFGLFVVLVEQDDTQLVMRRLQDFEAPYVSLKYACQLADVGKINANYRIIIRKWYWDPVYDADLLDDKVGCNLLFVQTVADLENGWIMAPKATARQLKQIQSKGDRKKYVEQAKTLHHYGHIQFLPVLTDFPKSNTRATISIGPRELCMQIMTDNGQSKEVAFKVTRMRCWKITLLEQESSALLAKEAKLELAFDYLFTKDKLQWVRLVGPQAVFMSSCLGSIVAELIAKSSGVSIPTPAEKHRKPLEAYIFKRNLAGSGLEYIAQCKRQVEEALTRKAETSSVDSTGTPPEVRRPKAEKPEMTKKPSNKTEDEDEGEGEVFSSEPMSPASTSSTVTSQSVTSSESSSRRQSAGGSTSNEMRRSTSSYTQLGQSSMKDRFKNFVVQGLTSQQGGVSTVGAGGDEEQRGGVFDTIDDEDL
ncbi:sorting nexin-17-like [Sycon ciliatum]|uniref:sorting nexin-17-like n=1 Tax=Sycon ciliatum TaxID=27933 RepID=UPI0020AAF6A3|eukprot:scpid41448/ scgid7015/ Sorting nexin-17